MTLLEMKVKTLNEKEGNLSGVKCPKCKDKGYIAFAKDNFLATRECDCMPKRRSIQRMKRSGLLGLLDAYTFDKFQTPESWQKSAKRSAMDFAENGMGKWFVVTGTPGTGKTHLCTSIASVLLGRGKEVRYMLWRNEAPRLKAIVNDREWYEEEVMELKRVDVLYIDDFFKGSVSDADVNLAFEILNDRYNDRKCSTIISSEKTIEEILSIDEAIGSRMYERSKGYCLKMPQKNWRLR